MNKDDLVMDSSHTPTLAEIRNYIGGAVENNWHEINQYIIVVIGYSIGTALEDSFLQKNLTGYRDYTWTVRYRLIPGVW